VPAAAFTPPPKVVSSVVELVPRREPAPCDQRLLSGLTLAAFGQRRKMLRQSLKGFAAALNADVNDLLAAAGIDGTRRAEEIDVDGFVALAQNAAQFAKPR
jgi:16S rRNA (adenine1518-N6/adenine1519-N6)-dimethyltransferase